MSWLWIVLFVLVCAAIYIFDGPGDHPICGCTRCRYMRRHRE